MKKVLLAVLLLACTVPSFGTMTDIPGGVFIPRFGWTGSVLAPAFGTAISIDASTDRFAMIVRAPKTCSLDRVVIHPATVTTSAALDVRIETVSATDGFPTGTLWAANTSATTGAPAANTPIEVTLTASASVALGDLFAVVVQSNTTPITLGLNTIGGTSMASGHGVFPYSATNTTGSYALSVNQPSIGVRCSTGEWQNTGGAGPIKSFSTQAFDDGTDTAATTGSRRGLYFQLPVPATLCGMWVKGAPAANTGNFNVKLYDAAGSALATLATMDANTLGATAAGAGQVIEFSGEASLSASTNYRLVIEPTTTNNFNSYEFTVNDANYMGAFDGGTNFYLTKYVSAAWVEVTTERPWMGLRLCQFDNGAGSSAGRFF